MASASESTPLLGETSQNIETSDGIAAPAQSEDEALVPSSTHFARIRRILTIVLLFSSMIAFVLLTAAHIMVISINFSDTYYYLRSSGTLYVLTMAALFFAAINLKWNFPIFLNIVLDFFLAFFMIGAAINTVDFWPGDTWCRDQDWRNPDRPSNDKGPACHAELLAVRILLGVAVGLAWVIVLSHLILFVLRSVALWRTNFWNRPMPFPTGSITLEVSLRVRGQERGETQALARE